MKKYIGMIGLIVVIICSIPLVIPLFHEGYFPVHDDTQIARVEEMAEALSYGQFPVRWVGDLGYGYGYPIFNFYSPLPYYVGGLCVMLGFSGLWATKIMFGLGVFLSGITMFFLGKKVWGIEGGVLAAILYQYAPYHAVNIYIRGAVGEYWAVGWLPLVFLGIVGLLGNVGKERKMVYVFVVAIGYAGVILSHNIIAMLLSGFLVPFLVYEGYVFRKQMKSGYIVLLGLGLSAFFWLPAIVEMKYTQVDKIIGGAADVRNHFVFIDQLWNSPWGFAGSAAGRVDGMSFKIGKIHVLLGMLGIWLMIGRQNWSRKKWLNGWSVEWLVVFILICSVYMTTKYSEWVWDMIPALAFVQFPWRFLVFIIFALSLLAGGAMGIVHDWSRWVVLGGICSGILWFNMTYFQPQEYYMIDEEIYQSDTYVKWRTSKISDEYLPKEFPVPDTELSVPASPFTSIYADSIVVQTNSPSQKKATVISSYPTDVFVNIAYFPGWYVLLDGIKVHHVVENGIMMVAIPAGRHVVEAVFGNTPVRLVGNIISVLSIALVFGTIIHTKNRYGKKNIS